MSSHGAVSAKVARIVLLAALGGLTACSGGSTSVEDEDTDRTPPGIVSDLAVVEVTCTSATLEWTAPADERDDGTGGPVVGYDLRRALERITAQTFPQAQPVQGAPAPLPPGQRHHLLVAGLAPGTTHYFSLKACDDRGNWSDVSYCPAGACPPLEVVTFPDPALEQAIRDHVHKPSGDLLTADVDTIVHFAAVEAEIVSLAGMERCTSLASAQLGGNGIVDLTPLGQLWNLGGLYLGSNQVSDLQPLVGLPGLRQLHLIWNPVTDLRPVAYLLSLEQLTLSGTEIADFSPLWGLEVLHDLYLGGMNLENIDFLVNVRHLRSLSLEINRIYSAEALGGLVTLESLNLMQNLIVDLGPLEALVNLRELHLGKNRVTDLQALVDNPGLGADDVVRLNENPLSQTAVDVQIPALEARGVVVVR